MNADKIKKILDESNVNITDEIDIVEYVYSLEGYETLVNKYEKETMQYKKALFKILDYVHARNEEGSMNPLIKEDISNIIKESNINQRKESDL